MPNATVRANARTLPEATEPESAADEYLRLMAEKIVAEARLEVATEKRKAEATKASATAAQAEEDSGRPTRLSTAPTMRG